MLLPGIEIRESPGKGRGLFTTVAIPKGQVVWHPCTECEVFLPETLPGERRDEIEELGYYLADGSQILPCRGACFFNHSCEPNVLDYGLDFGLAVRDIAAGEELAIDYRTFRADPPWVVQCRCGAAECVGDISPRPTVPAELEARWQARIRPALEALRTAPQPLESSLFRCSQAYLPLRSGGTAPTATAPSTSILEPIFMPQFQPAGA